MLASLLGITMAFVLQQGDVQREHLKQDIICLYQGDPDSIWYLQRHSGKWVANIQWIEENQYEA